MGCASSKSGVERDASSAWEATTSEVERTHEPVRDARAATANERAFAERYELGESISRGGFSLVHAANERSTGRKRAVKVIRVRGEASSEREETSSEETSSGEEDEEEEEEEEKEEEEEEEDVEDVGSVSSKNVMKQPKKSMLLKEVRMEYELAREARHPSVVRAYDFYYDPPSAFVVMEMLEGEELLETLLARGQYDEDEARALMGQILRALQACHAKHIIHRDVKLENMCFAKKDDINSLRLTDFGLATRLANARNKCKDNCGTSSYVAPEILLSQPYNAAVDVWSAGVMLYLLLCGELPFYVDDENDEELLFTKISLRSIAPISCDVSDDAVDLVDRLLIVEPAKRLTAEEALLHPWFKGPDALHYDDLGRNRLARYIAKQPKGTFRERTFAKGEFICRRDGRAREIFVIKSGACEELIDAFSRELSVRKYYVNEVVGDRGLYIPAGVIEMSDAEDEDEMKSVARANFVKFVRLVFTLLRVKNIWLGGRRKVSIKALVETVVTIISGSQLRRIVEEDYGVYDELISSRANRASLIT